MDQDILWNVRDLINLGIPHYLPLYYIVLRGHKTIVKVLFKYGAKTYIFSSKSNITQLESEI